MIEHDTLVLVNKSVLLEWKVNDMSAPMGSLSTHPLGVKAAKKNFEVSRKHGRMKATEESMKNIFHTQKLLR